MLPIAIVVVVVVGVISFVGGMKYAGGKSNSQSDFQRFGQMGAGGIGNQGGNRGTGRVGGVGMGGGLVNGEILSKDDQSITVKLRDGGSKIVFYSTSTEISKLVAGTTADLEVDKTVMISGKTNADGSVVAQTVQMRPVAPVVPDQKIVPVTEKK